MTAETPEPPRPDLTEMDRGELIDYAHALRRTNADVLAENMRLRGLVAGDPQVLRQAADGLAVRHWAARLLAVGFADEFRREGAKNCGVGDMYPPDMPALSVTMQVKGGVSPAERIAALEAEVAALSTRLAA